MAMTHCGCATKYEAKLREDFFFLVCVSGLRTFSFTCHLTASMHSCVCGDLQFELVGCCAILAQ